MKEYTENNSHLDKRNAGACDSDMELEWFNQFEEQPGIYDVYDIAALENMKKTMLLDLVKKINEMD